MPTYSLLHATYRRGGPPTEIRDAWLDRADRPGDVEHIFAVDEDDLAAIAATEGSLRAVSPADPDHVTAVRNWNAAAGIASGDLLVVVADDLYPPRGWDTALSRLFEPLDPRTVDFAIKLTDSHRDGDTLMRHPAVSRAFYERLGLFHPGFHGAYCDDDITRRAFWHSVIIDGRSLVLKHVHPSVDQTVGESESQRRVNTVGEYQHGERLYISLWSRRHRDAPVRLVPSRYASGWSGRVLSLWARERRGEAYAAYIVQRTVAAARLLSQPSRLVSRSRDRS